MVVAAAADGRADIGDGEGLTGGPHDDVGAGADEDGEPSAEAELAGGDLGDHGLDVAGLGGGEAQAEDDVVEELVRVVELLFLVGEDGAGAGGADADEGAGGAGDAADLGLEAVEFLEKAAGVADEVAGGVIAG